MNGSGAMIIGLRLLGSVFLVLAFASVCVADGITGSIGAWAGKLTVGPVASLESGSSVELKLSGSNKRFAVSFVVGDRVLLDGEFQQGSRPGMYEPPASVGLLSFLGSKTPANPLKGMPLAWARTSEGALILYKLEVLAGNYVLDRVRLEPGQVGMHVAFERRRPEKSPERFEADLTRGQE